MIFGNRTESTPRAGLEAPALQEDPMTDMQSLAERVDRLETGNRRLKRICGGVIAVAGLAFLLGQTAPLNPIIEAGGFILRDNAGNIRGDWRVADDDSTVLAMIDAEGKPRAGLGVLQDGETVFSLHDREGMSRGHWRVFADGATALNLLEKDGNPRAGFAVLPDGTTMLDLSNRQGKSRGSWMVLPDGKSTLSLRDEKGKARCRLDVNRDGTTTIWLIDAEGKARGMWGMLADGSPSLEHFDKEERLIFRTP